MIILAAAIILSLQSSGIIGKANKAKTDTNDTQLLEAATLHLAEYDLAEKTGDVSIAGKDAQTYVREKLVKDGFVEEEAEKIVIKDGTAKIATLADKIEALNVPIGTTVNGYALTQKSYTTNGNENNGVAQELNTVTTLTWKYAGTDADGDVIIVADMPSEMPNDLIMTLDSINGVQNGPRELTNACKAMYSVTGKGNARCMTKEDFEAITKNGEFDFINLNFTNESITNDFGINPYPVIWISTNNIYEGESPDDMWYNMFVMENSARLEEWTINGFAWTLAFIPVVELDESVNVSYADDVLTIN